VSQAPERFVAFDELAGTDATRAALARLRSATGAGDGPMERHCLRARHIAARLAADRGWTIDDELLTVAAILHDIGLYPTVSRGGVYTADGAALARQLLAEHGWSPERIERCERAIDRHHELRGQLSQGAEVEALRLADRVELSAGILSHGIERAWLRSLYAHLPRHGLVGELVREIGRALRERPLTLPQIFRRA
jgi:HD superfamily phosphodiesterase